jgi:2-polyprenyl-3-methyl-5-hydroxy-6-metoxy-1,4-benzoquinol methylase
MPGTAFDPVTICWVCGGRTFRPVHEARFDLGEYTRQDPELAAYSGGAITLQRCTVCGFAQPAALPTLPRFFDRLYDQRWDDHWIAAEHEAKTKDLIFHDILTTLSRRVREGRRLLDVGAHAGRFLRLARAAGWDAEGLELNPKTAAYAAAASGAPVLQGNVHSFQPAHPYDAVTLTDVLEHIPQPLEVLTRVHALLAPGGYLAVKVPNGPAQRVKENLRARLRPAYRATLADNLVHVNHFSARSLARALERTGYRDIEIVAGAPELPQAPHGGLRDRWGRLAAFRVARIVPGGAALPLAFNLQAYAARR